jgi:hypothetical protein
VLHGLRHVSSSGSSAPSPDGSSATSRRPGAARRHAASVTVAPAETDVFGAACAASTRPRRIFHGAPLRSPRAQRSARSKAPWSAISFGSSTAFAASFHVVTTQRALPALLDPRREVPHAGLGAALEGHDVPVLRGREARIAHDAVPVDLLLTRPRTVATRRGRDPCGVLSARTSPSSFVSEVFAEFSPQTDVTTAVTTAHNSTLREALRAQSLSSSNCSCASRIAR